MVGPRAVIRSYPRGAKVDRARVTAGLPLIARRIFQAFQNRTDIVDMPDRAVADRREIVGEIDQPDDPPVRPRMRGRVHGRAQRYTAGNVFVTVNTDNAAHTLQINQLNTVIIATSDTDNARQWRVTRYGRQLRMTVNRPQAAGSRGPSGRNVALWFIIEDDCQTRSGDRGAGRCRRRTQLSECPCEPGGRRGVGFVSQPRTATRGGWVVGIGRIKRPPARLALRCQGTPSPQLYARAGCASASQSQNRAGQCQAAGDPEQRCPATWLGRHAVARI